MGPRRLVQVQVDITGVAIVATYTRNRIPIRVTLFHGQEGALGFLSRLRKRADKREIDAFKTTVRGSAQLLRSSTTGDYRLPKALTDTFLELVRTGLKRCSDAKVGGDPLKAIKLEASPPPLLYAVVARDKGKRFGGTALILYTDPETSEPSAFVIRSQRTGASFLHACGERIKGKARERLIELLEWLPRVGAASYRFDAYTAALLHVGYFTKNHHSAYPTLH